MIKNFKSITAATLALICVGFTSCSDDDNDEPGSYVDVVTENVNPAKVFTQGVPSVVGEYTITKNAEGLVTKIVADDGYEYVDVYTFDYTGATANTSVTPKSRANRPTDYDMTMNISRHNGEESVDFFIKLNAQGFIEYAYEEYDDYYGHGLKVHEWWFKYNATGQLIEMQFDNDVTYIIYNADGDITRVSDRYMETTVSYTDSTHTNAIVNKSGIMLYDHCFNIDLDEMEPVYFAGLLGKGTKHLPLSCTLSDSSNRDSTVFNFEWVLNANDMPIKLNSTYTVSGSTGKEDPIIFKW